MFAANSVHFGGNGPETARATGSSRISLNPAPQFVLTCGAVPVVLGGKEAHPFLRANRRKALARTYFVMVSVTKA